MFEITQKQIDDAIRDCHWKRDVAGVPVCGGEVAPCSVVIDNGKCDALIQLFSQSNTGDTKSK